MLDFIKLAYSAGAKLAEAEYLDDTHGALAGLPDPGDQGPDPGDQGPDPVYPGHADFVGALPPPEMTPGAYDQAVDWLSRRVMPSLDIVGAGGRARGGVSSNPYVTSAKARKKLYAESIQKHNRSISTAHQGELPGTTPISERVDGNKRGISWWHW